MKYNAIDKLFLGVKNSLVMVEGQTKFLWHHISNLFCI